MTDPESAKMATNKGVIQGYAAQAAVDSAHQVIIAVDVIGSGSEQSMLLPMIEQAAPYRENHTLITADAGYHSEAIVEQLMQEGIPALIADNPRCASAMSASLVRANTNPGTIRYMTNSPTGRAKPIKQFKPDDFSFNDDNTCTCPAGKTLKSTGSIYTTVAGLHYQRFTAQAPDCQPPAQQAAYTLKPAWAREGQHAVAPVLHGAQHRKACQQRLEAVRKWSGARRVRTPVSKISRNIVDEDSELATRSKPRRVRANWGFWSASLGVSKKPSLDLSTMRRQILALVVTVLGSISACAAEQCTDRPECWPEGSAMHSGLMLVQKQKAAEKTLERNHAQLLTLVSSTKSPDRTFGTDERLLEALKSQQAAWLKYKNEECELVGSLSGAGGSWPSTYANQCEVNHLEQRDRRVRSAIRCVEKLPNEKRIFEQSNCLQQLAPLTNK